MLPAEHHSTSQTLVRLRSLSFSCTPRVEAVTLRLSAAVRKNPLPEALIRRRVANF